MTFNISSFENSQATVTTNIEDIVTRNRETHNRLGDVLNELETELSVCRNIYEMVLVSGPQRISPRIRTKQKQLLQKYTEASDVYKEFLEICIEMIKHSHLNDTQKQERIQELMKVPDIYDPSGEYFLQEESDVWIKEFIGAGIIQ